MNRSWLDDFRQMEDRSLLPYLSAHIRQNSTFRMPFDLDVRNWEQLAKIHKAAPVVQKMERLLSLVAQRTDPPGSQVSFTGEDSPLIDAVGFQELLYLFQQLEELGYIDLNVTSGNCICGLKAKGWASVQEQRIAGIPGRCFVAMSFHDSLNEAWEKGIEPALRTDCGMDPVRVDKREHNEKICDKIIAEIRMCQFLVADFTLHRQGVYFEAGFALGLGRPVIWMCREDEFAPEKVHFDTRQYNHIVWTSPDDLRVKLANRVIATIPEAATQSFSR
jgi:hypothetical protein